MAESYKYYKWGVPETNEEALEFKKVIDERHDKQNFKAAWIIDDTNSRLTEKSVGLLQADSILAAIAALYAANGDLKVPATACLIAALITCLYLLFNLKVHWASDAKVFADPEHAFLVSVEAARGRAKRFVKALWLSFVAFVTTILMALYAVSPWA